MGFKSLTTTRLFLRPLKSSDWEAISFLRSDPKVNQYVKRPPAETKEQALAFIKNIEKGMKTGEMLYWCIAPKEQEKMIGSICLWHFSADGKTGEVGYDLHPDWQGKGIMTESLAAILQFGFEDLDLDEIEAYTQCNNRPSCLLLESHGFKLNPKRNDESNPLNVIYKLKKESWKN